MSEINAPYMPLKSVHVVLVFLLVLFSIRADAQHKLVRIWETDTVMAEPESVLLLKNGMYASLVDGKPLDADGKGEIAKLGLKGKILNDSWVTELNAPKGMGLWKDKLYVADITEMIVIDTATAKIIDKIPFEGARGLNDITVDDTGTIYVSDPETGVIYCYKNGSASPYLNNLPGVNGLFAVGKELYMVTDKMLYECKPDKKLIALTTIPSKGADGISPVGNGDFLFTLYTGLIYYMHKDGTKELLLDTKAQKIGSADISFDPVNHIRYVPTLFRNSVVSYLLN